MAHIVSCMLDPPCGDLASYIAKQQNSSDSLPSSISSSEERKPFAWRMQQPADPKKYQLFPRDKQPAAAASNNSTAAAATTVKQLDLEQQPATSTMAEKANGLRLRIKEHNLIRRRKVSVPELGPMTTVQEVPMDSPTIPGRPPLHERSISSPANSWYHLQMAEVAAASGLETTKESPDASTPTTVDWLKSSTKAAVPGPSAEPRSPKSLAPLVIPSQSGGTLPRLARQLSLNRLRSGSNPCETTTRPSKVEESPRTRTPFTPFTPQSAAYITTPKSAVTSSTLPTPISAAHESRGSPRPWDKHFNIPTSQPASVDPQSTPKVDIDQSRSATSLSQRTEPDMTPQPSAPVMSHRRNVSDTGSIMERGRPRKRSDGSLVGATLRRTASKRSKSSERQAFEKLPHGWKPSDAAKHIEHNEATYLHKQAYGQAMRFEVLKKEDVETLSKELRYLDERTEYLRRTYTSLRAGRRNLHSRICQYLRSPRVAKFSYDSMLKQEEALAELDSSIDDWVTKLEYAENRRTRVRQKLLEHVAAAATMSVPSDIVGASESLQKAMDVQAHSGPPDVSTPPRSPAKAESHSHSLCSSPSPQRVVARVPSAIPEVPAEQPTPGLGGSTLQRMESIRIYADSDVYALLADVESEFTKLSTGYQPTPEPVPTRSSDELRKAHHRAQSHDALNRGSPTRSFKSTPLPPPAPSPPSKEAASDKDTSGDEGEIFLTSAVFQPAAVTVA